MSDFHGGYYARLAKPDLEALRRLGRTVLLGSDDVPEILDDPEQLSACTLSVTPAPNSDALLITLRGPFTAGRGEDCYWYQDEANHAFVRLLSQEAGVPGYAYSFENRVGVESLHVYQDGALVAEDSLAWDDAVSAGRAKDDWPLSRLGRALGLTREELEFDLPLMGAGIGIPLEGDGDLAPLAQELSALRAELKGKVPERPAPDEAAVLEQERHQAEEDEAWDREAAKRLRRSEERAKQVNTAVFSGCLAIPGGGGAALLIRLALGAGDGVIPWLTAICVIGLFVGSYALLRRWQKNAPGFGRHDL